MQRRRNRVFASRLERCHERHFRVPPWTLRRASTRCPTDAFPTPGYPISGSRGGSCRARKVARRLGLVLTGVSKPSVPLASRHTRTARSVASRMAAGRTTAAALHVATPSRLASQSANRPRTRAPRRIRVARAEQDAAPFLKAPNRLRNQAKRQPRIRSASPQGIPGSAKRQDSLRRHPTWADRSPVDRGRHEACLLIDVGSRCSRRRRWHQGQPISGNPSAATHQGRHLRGDTSGATRRCSDWDSAEQPAPDIGRSTERGKHWPATWVMGLRAFTEGGVSHERTATGDRTGTAIGWVLSEVQVLDPGTGQRGPARRRAERRAGGSGGGSRSALRPGHPGDQAALAVREVADHAPSINRCLSSGAGRACCSVISGDDRGPRSSASSRHRSHVEKGPSPDRHGRGGAPRAGGLTLPT
jgi:hypothetical protein